MATDAGRIKVVVVGDGGSGKTVLLYSYTDKEYQDVYVPTVLDTYSADVVIGGLKIPLEIFDTAGQEDFTEIRTLIYPGTHVFIMCYSCVFRDSLENIKKFWYPETVSDQPGVPFILVGNKLDLKIDNPRDYIDESEAILMMEELGAKAQLQCSARDEAVGIDSSGKVERVFKTAIKYGLEAKSAQPPKPSGNGCCTIL